MQFYYNIIYVKYFIIYFNLILRLAIENYIISISILKLINNCEFYVKKQTVL